MDNLAKVTRLQKRDGTAEAIWPSVPSSLAKTLTDRQLAQVVNAMHAHWQKAVAHTKRNAINSGYI